MLSDTVFNICTEASHHVQLGAQSPEFQNFHKHQISHLQSWNSVTMAYNDAITYNTIITMVLF